MKQLKYILLIVLFITGFTNNIIAQKGVTATEISGTVYESSTKKPLAGAKVSIPGVTSAITSEDGKFKLLKTIKGAYLTIEAPGFASKTITAINNTKEIAIFLFEESFKGNNEETAIPFGTINSLSSTAAIAAHQNKEDYKLCAPTIETVLQSNFSGLNTVSRTGAPGAGANMFLHGFSSLNATCQPLIIVDGVQYENQSTYSLIGGNNISALSDIDVKDIDNISVLKNGASIYGSKAANGVIIINTIQAKDPSTRINFFAYTGVNLEPSTKYKMMDASDYKSYLTDMLSSGGLTSSQIQSLPFINTTKPVVENWGISGNKDYYRYNQSTNWQDEVFNNSLNQNYHLNVTGGNDAALYAISFGYLGQGGLINKTNFSKYTTRVNAKIKMTEWFKLNTNMSFIYSDRNLAYEGLDKNFSPAYAALVKAPFTAPNIYNVDGERTPNLESVDPLGVSNPIAIINNSTAKNQRSRFTGNLNALLNLNKFLDASVLIGITSDKTSEKIFLPMAGVNHTALPNATVTNESQQLRNSFSQINADAHLTYVRTFNYVHKINANLGTHFQSSASELDWGKAYNSSSDEMKTLGDGDASLAQTGGSLGDWKSLSTYLNADYSYLNRYFLSVNAALDGSSRFGKDAAGFKVLNGKFGLFPSIDAAWLISSEGFMKDQHFFDILKLRSGFSITGNDDIGNYSAKNYYTSEGLLGIYGLVRGNVSNSQLQWETNKKGFIGVDISLLKERLSISTDLYLSRTENLFNQKSVTTSAGIGYANYNDGTLENKGIDLTVNARIIDKPYFKWDITTNLSTYKNKLLSMSNDETFTTISGGRVRTKVGSPIAQFYGYKTDGVYSTAAEASSANMKMENADGSLVAFGAGDVKFVDQSINGVKDGIINEKDMVVIGDPNPDFIGSINNKFQWKQFSLTTLFTFSVGNDVYNAERASLESLSNLDNQTVYALNRWKTNGQVTNTPKATWGDPIGNSRFSSRWIEDGSYIRLKSLTLGYDLKVKSEVFKSVQFYVTGNNLITFTKYLGYDPEFSTGSSPLSYGIDSGVTPQSRSILFGVKIGL